ncbi:MAG: hypothetical protein ACOX5Z_07000 [Desulfobulbus sp.]|jgi:hypothetical protein
MNTKIFIYFYLFFFFCTLNAQAQNVILNASADLDGNGKQDTIYLSIDSKGKYNIKINDVSKKGELPDPDSLCDKAKFQMDIIDIDKSDKHKEVMICMYSDIDSCMDYTYHLFWYSGTSISLIWKLSSETPAFSGNGIALVSTWLNFWNKTDKYVLNPKTKTMVHVPQAFYYVGVEVKVNQSIPIFQSTTDKKIVAHLQKDSICSILLYDAPSGFYLIKSSTGLIGWSKETEKLALPSAG